MQVFSLLVISFACVVCPSLGKEGNYNEAERSLPENEWLNPWDMIHYDAAAQSLDNTVSLLLISPQGDHNLSGSVADCYFIVNVLDLSFEFAVKRTVKGELKFIQNRSKNRF